MKIKYVTTVVSKRLEKVTQQQKVTSYKTLVFLNLCERGSDLWFFESLRILELQCAHSAS